jgi:hypothetical protein
MSGHRSIVVPEHVKGYIYIEAFKQTHVKEAIAGGCFLIYPFLIVRVSSELCYGSSLYDYI